MQAETPNYADRLYSISQLICAFVISVVLIVFIYQSHKYRKSKSTLANEFVIQTRLLMANLVFIIITTSVVGICMMKFSFYGTKWPTGAKLGLFTRTISISLWECLQFSRLYFVFKPTAYALSRFTLTTLTFIMIFGNSFDLAFDATLDYNLVYISYGCPIIITTIVTGLFCVKLHKLTLTMRKSNINIISIGNKHNNDNDNNDNGISSMKVDLTPKQQKLLNAIAKQALLNFWQTFFCILLILWNLFNVRVKSETWIVAIGYLAISCSIAIAAFCLWLTFVFADKQYKILCGKCHCCCLNCIETTTIFFIKKQMKKQYVEIQTHQDYVNMDSMPMVSDQ